MRKNTAVLELKEALPLRRSLRKRKHSPSEVVPFISKRSKRCFTAISKLPDEIILDIFSYLPQQHLGLSVGLVCKRWNYLTKDPSLWMKLSVDSRIPTRILTNWISVASKLRHLIVKDRNDLNYIFELVSQKCKLLETIEVLNCWGSADKWPVHSTPLCNLVKRCWKLRNIRFEKTMFKSCKFFQLLTQDKNKSRQIRACSYIGPLTAKQLGALLQSTKNYQLENSAILGNQNRMYKLVDITKLLDNRSPVDQNNIIQAVWNAINDQHDIDILNLNFVDINVPQNINH